MPKIDFSQVKGLEPVPEGWYDLTITQAEEKLSQGGNEVINLTCKIDGGEYDGRVIFDMLVFSEKTLWRVKRALQAINPKAFGEKFKGEIDTEDLVGQTFKAFVLVEVSTQVDPETGEPYPDRNRIKLMKPFGSNVGKKASDLV